MHERARLIEGMRVTLPSNRSRVHRERQKGIIMRFSHTIPQQPGAPVCLGPCGFLVSLETVTTTSHPDVRTPVLAQASALCGLRRAAGAAGVAPRPALGPTLGLLDALRSAAGTVGRQRPAWRPLPPALQA